MYQAGCRCPDCRYANAVFQKKTRHQRAQWLAEEPDVVEHGKLSTYNNWMCRCDPCKEVKSKTRYVRSGI